MRHLLNFACKCDFNIIVQEFSGFFNPEGFKRNANGNVTVEIDGKIYNGTVKNGIAEVLLANAEIGTHRAHVIYWHGETHETLESVVEVHIKNKKIHC